MARKRIVDADLLEEILSRTEVKFLLRMKSTCKYWHSVIESQYFMNLHIEKSKIARNGIFVGDDGNGYKLVNPDEDEEATEILRRPEETSEMRLIGVNDGLVCYMDYTASKICVWNPAIGLSKTGRVDTSKNWLYGNAVIFYWFGRSGLLDDKYDLIIGTRPVEYAGQVYRKGFNLIRLRSSVGGNYESIQETTIDDSDLLLLSDEGVHLNGIIHWVAKKTSVPTLDSSQERIDHFTKKGNVDMCRLLTYDLRAGTVGEVGLPMGKDFYTTIGVIDGKLCAIVPLGKGDVSTKYGVWCMTNYELKDWIRLFIIKSSGFEGISKLSLLGQIGDSFILRASPGCQIFRYDRAANTANTVKSLISSACHSRFYFPSLLPP